MNTVEEHLAEMRRTARVVGLTRLIIQIANTPADWTQEDTQRLRDVLEILGVSEEELQ